MADPKSLNRVGRILILIIMANVHAGKDLILQLEKLFSAGGGTSANNYFAWMSGGLLYDKEQLAYLQMNLDDLKTAALDEFGNGKSVYLDGINFMQLLNAIPSSNELKGDYAQSGRMLWDEYASVLREAVFPNAKEKTDEDDQKLERIQIQYTALEPAYLKYKKLYDKAAAKYEAAKSAALFDPQKARMFALSTGKTLKSDADMAMNNWIGMGQKKTVDNLVNQTLNFNREFANSWINTLMAKLKAYSLSDLNQLDEMGAPPYHTYLASNDFMDGSAQWTEVTFDASSVSLVDSTTNRTFSSYTESNSGFWFWKSRTTTTTTSRDHEKMDETKVAISSIKFKCIQVPILRPWFEPGFLTCGAWKWRDANFAALSDGKPNPVGSLIAYPTTALFVKDVEVAVENMETLNRFMKGDQSSQFNSVGPFRLFRSRETSSRAEHKDYETTIKQDSSASGTVSISGTQLIGFKCFALPKAPVL